MGDLCGLRARRANCRTPPRSEIISGGDGVWEENERKSEALFHVQRRRALIGEYAYDAASRDVPVAPMENDRRCPAMDHIRYSDSRTSNFPG